jgi:hypothetical protein
MVNEFWHGTGQLRREQRTQRGLAAGCWPLAARVSTTVI